MLLKDIIAEYRKKNNLSQRSFATKCGVTNGYISMIENGLNPSTGKAPVPSLSTLKQIANGMGMTVHQLSQIADDMEIDIGTNDARGLEIDQLSPAALSVAIAYDKMTAYGKAIINCVIEQENASRMPKMKAVPVFETAHDSNVYARYNAMRERQELEEEQKTENKSE